MDSETLTFLLRGGHLNMPERIERGLWPHPPLKFSDVVRRLIKVLESEKWFPHEWKPAGSGEPIYEGGVIEHQSSSKYIYRAQRSYADNSHQVAEQGEIVFTSAEDAARYYLKWDLHLLGDLDGWKVVA
jgi:hypothetical protein